MVKSRLEYDNKSEKRGKVTIPSNLLFKCPRCLSAIFVEDFERNNKVCVDCNYHSRLTYLERLNLTADKGSFIEHDADMISCNPIEFPEYANKIKELNLTTGLNDGVVSGECTIMAIRCMIIIMDTRFMMASMGSVAGEKITRVFETAIEKNLPVIIFSASGGARMQEGIVSLMQMAKTSAAVAKHNEAGLLYINIITDPTTGGVTASFASLADIIIAEPKVLIGFAGRRVIESTIKQRLPNDFQSAELMLKHGFIDMIVDRINMRKTLFDLLKLHGYGGVANE